MKNHIIVYTSDLHGNETQYEKLVAYSREIHADSIIIGGDIAPKDSIENFIQNQRDFLQNRLPLLLLKKEKHTRVFLILGNDDCRANEDAALGSELYTTIHKKRVPLTKDFDIIGYSHVPITPFLLKDWEKFDLNIVPEDLVSEYERRKGENYRLDGFKSTMAGWREFLFKQEDEQDSIQKDLSQDLYRENPRKTIYVIHTPPNHTNLDIIMNGSHVGSMAVRLFIEECQPYLTLHGHIHETVQKSGNFRVQIGNTLSLASGNSNIGSDLAVIVFDIYDLQSARRYIL